MKIESFIKLIVDELEIEGVTITPETVLDDLEEWDSMGAMVIIGLVSEHFDVILKGKDLADVTTVQSLIKKIGIDKFS